MNWRIAALTCVTAALICGTAVAVDYPTGDSCLFCHRNEIGSTWLDNAHAWTVRPKGEPPAVDSLPTDATHVVGSVRSRGLKQAGYGKFSLWDGAAWQHDLFAKGCAGCHTTAVDARTGEFSAIGLDCYACHGNVPEDHAQKRGTALLSRARESNAKEIVSICGSCHLRGGRSQSTGLPYPAQFVPGADLFADFKVALKGDMARLDDNDRHVYESARAILEGSADDTCVDCHRIHAAPESADPKRRRFSSTCQY